MPRAKPFDKKTSTTYALVHRPQNDPLIHDADAPSQVFAELPSSSKHSRKSKIKQRGDLEEEFGLSASIRDNEGEAAEHGIYFDDSSYDYMQHMRDLGGSAESTWLEPSATAQLKGKGKAKQSLEDALRDADLNDADDDLQSLGGSSVAQSAWAPRSAPQRTYESQQDVPDVLAGFQPDMDPRLREVLEALDDEEYVDDEDDIFAELAADGGGEVDQYEWEATLFDDEDEDDGWESDDTTKPTNEYRSTESSVPHPTSTDPDITPSDSAKSEPSASEEDGDWLASFAKSKGSSAPPPFAKPSGQQQNSRPADLASSAALTSASQFPRRKKRKGALSSSTGFSMTSSALARTEPLSTLDSRFDKIAESYLEDEDGDGEGFDDTASFATGMSRASAASNFSKASAFGGSQASEAPSLVPAGFDAILDDFLGGSSGKGRGRAMRKAGTQGQWGQQSGMEQLDEIRKGLGPARLSKARKAPVQKV